MEKLFGTIETQIQENASLLTELVSNGQPLATYQSDTPQIQTQITVGSLPLVSVINAPFVEVTSVNGQTGDVVVQPIVEKFQANFPYKENNLVAYNGSLYLAKSDFTSGSAFNNDDWVLVEASGAADWASITNKPTFATVATSGSYTDLSNKPAINDATLTIQKNGADVAVFTANSATNVTANLSIPTALSQLTNDGNYVVDADYVHTDSNYTASEKMKLAGVETGAQVNPTNSELLDLFYPVGSYYETSDEDFNPNVAWGGTWEEDTDGLVLVAQDAVTIGGAFETVGDIGGEETHILTVGEMPAHTHNTALTSPANGTSGGGTWFVDSGTKGSSGNQSWTSTSTGGGQAHNNLQPYIVVKRWHRTA